MSQKNEIKAKETVQLQTVNTQVQEEHQEFKQQNISTQQNQKLLKTQLQSSSKSFTWSSLIKFICDFKHIIISACIIAFILVILISLVGFAVFSKVQAQEVFDLVILNSESAKCNDGSPYAYYVSRTGNESKILILMVGGAWAAESTKEKTLESFFARSQTFIGSSLYSPSTRTFEQGILSKRDDNYFKDWKKVFMLYCDGSGYQGTRKEPLLYNNRLLYFRGHNITVQTFDELQNKYGIYTKAENVVLSGQSAGGIAVYTWANYLQSKIKKANFRAISDSSIFYDTEGKKQVSQNFKLNYKNMMKFTNQQIDFPVPQCVQKFRDAQENCMFVQNLYQHLKMPIFHTQSVYDTYKLQNTLNLKCSGKKSQICDEQENILVDENRKNVTELLKGIASKKQNGVWGAKCLFHALIIYEGYSSSNFKAPTDPIELVLSGKKGLTAAEAIEMWMQNPQGQNVHIDQSEFSGFGFMNELNKLPEGRRNSLEPLKSIRQDSQTEKNRQKQFSLNANPELNQDEEIQEESSSVQQYQKLLKHSPQLSQDSKFESLKKHIRNFRCTLMSAVMIFGILIVLGCIVGFALYSKYASSQVLDLIFLNSQSARCNDGSPYAYYISRSEAKPNSAVPSPMNQTEDIQKESLANATTTISKTGKKYSSSTVTAQELKAQKKEPLVYKNTSLYLRGYNNTVEAFDDLQARFGLYTKTEKVVLSGESAAGIAVTMWANYLQSKIQKAEFRVIQDSGIFYDTEGKKSVSQNMKLNFKNMMKFSNQEMDFPLPECFQKYRDAPENCMFVQNLYEFNKVPTFYLQSSMDEYVMTGQLRLSCAENDIQTCSEQERQLIQENRRNVTNLLRKIAEKKSNSVYGTKCLLHGLILSEDYENKKVAIPLEEGSSGLLGKKKYKSKLGNKKLDVRGHNNTVEAFQDFGQSAGGLAVITWANYLQSKIIKAKFRAISDSGVFIDTEGKKQVSQNLKENYKNMMKLANQEIDFPVPECVSNYRDTPENCMFAQNLHRFIKVPTFYFQSLEDEYVIPYSLKVDCSGKDFSTCSEEQRKLIDDNRKNVTQLLKKIGENQQNGVWATICLSHRFIQEQNFLNEKFAFPLNENEQNLLAKHVLSVADAIHMWMENPSGQNVHIDNRQFKGDGYCK